MRIPTPASMSTGRTEPFQALLDRAAAPPPAPAPVAERAPEAAPEPVVPEPEGERPAAPADEPFAAADVAPECAAFAAEPAAAGGGVEAAVQNPFSRGEPVRQETAGKGADSPRTSTANVAAGDTLLAAAGRGAGPSSNAVFVLPGNQAAAGAASREVAVPTRGVGPTAAGLRTPLRAEAAAPGYRTSGAASAQLLDQARDSVFKQILVQLQDGGGEMRVRLQPPELGELDLRLVVTEGNKLSLHIAAEHQELTGLLQRHLGELEQALQAAGLQVTGAEVQTRSEREASAAPFEAGTSGAWEGGGDTAPAPNRPRYGGVLRGDGLDFWV
jgi:hypothetical protein